MCDVVRANPAAAMRGGEPGTYPLVRGFVGLRLQMQNLQGLADGIIGDRPLWPMVYYCLRSGDPSAALHCLKKAGYVCILRHFLTFIFVGFSYRYVALFQTRP